MPHATSMLFTYQVTPSIWATWKLEESHPVDAGRSGEHRAWMRIEVCSSARSGVRGMQGSEVDVYVCVISISNPSNDRTSRPIYITRLPWVMDGDKEIRMISSAVVAIVSQRTSYPEVVPLSEALSRFYWQGPIPIYVYIYVCTLCLVEDPKFKPCTCQAG
jgi:hypothetical protein